MLFVTFLRRVYQSTFLRHNAILFFGSVAVGGLNYLYYPVLGRLMSPAAFGEVQALVSLFLQLSIFLNVLSIIAIGVITNAKGGKEAERTILDLEKASVLVGCVLLVVTVIFAPWLQKFFKFDSTWPFITLALAVLASVPFTFRTAYLRARKRFGLVSWSNIFVAGGKLLLSAVLVVVGLSTFGAMLGIVGAQLFAFIYAAFWAHRVGLMSVDLKSYLFRLPALKRLLPELKYATLVLVVSLVITIQYSVDVVIVKHYFEPAMAGLYAGIATVARIIFFLTASVVQVMLPSVKIELAPAKNRQLLYKSAFLTIIVAVPAWLACVFIPEPIVRLLMGADYSTLAALLLPRLATAVFLISILNLFMLYFTALRRYGIAIVGIIGSGVTITLILTDHSSLQLIVDGLLFGSIAMMCLLIIWISLSNAKRGLRDKAATHFDSGSGIQRGS